MHPYVETYIIDNDFTGDTGRGTIFGLNVCDGHSVKTYEYGLLDLLDGTFDLTTAKQPAFDAKTMASVTEVARQQQTKILELVKRQEDAHVTDECIDIIREVIESNPKAVDQFVGGKVKAKDALVGMTMKILKERKITNASAFAISHALSELIEPLKENQH